MTDQHWEILQPATSPSTDRSAALPSGRRASRPVVLALAVAAVGVLGAVAWFLQGEAAERVATVPPPAAATHAYTALLEEGSCFEPHVRQEAGEVQLLDCDEPYLAEVFANYELPFASVFPGEQEDRLEAEKSCRTRFSDATGIPAAESEYGIYALPPSVEVCPTTAGSRASSRAANRWRGRCSLGSLRRAET